MSATYCPIHSLSSRLEIAALLPGPDLLALHHLDVVGEAAHDEHVRELRAEAVVDLGGPALLRCPNVFGFCTLFAEKKQALSESLRNVSAMKPSSESSNSRRSLMSTSVGILVCSSPIASYWWSGRLSTVPPACGPMMFGHQRYLAKLSARRVANA